MKAEETRKPEERKPGYYWFKPKHLTFFNEVARWDGENWIVEGMGKMSDDTFMKPVAEVDPVPITRSSEEKQLPPKEDGSLCGKFPRVKRDREIIYLEHYGPKIGWCVISEKTYRKGIESDMPLRFSKAIV